MDLGQILRYFHGSRSDLEFDVQAELVFKLFTGYDRDVDGC